MYLVAPLTNPQVSLAGLIGSRWLDWQYLLTAISTLLYLCLIPFAIASGVEAFRRKQWQDAAVFYVPMLVLWIAIAGGNNIIQERYRIMGVPFLWACIWLGRECKWELVKRAYVLWLCLLVFAGGSFVIYKYVL